MHRGYLKVHPRDLGEVKQKWGMVKIMWLLCSKSTKSFRLCSNLIFLLLDKIKKMFNLVDSVY